MNDTLDILIAGGGVGGIAAALRATAMGCSVILVDENQWLGGQITSQGVSVLDEHRLMYIFGGTSLYNDFKERIRQHYINNYNLSQYGKEQKNLNPGYYDWKMRLSFEPTIGVKVIEDMLSPAIKSGLLNILKPAKVVDIHKNKDVIEWAIVKNLETGAKTKIFTNYYIDATELGDLLPLAGIPYSTGVESFTETHEPSAPQESIPQACQSFTYTFAVELKPGTVNTISKPELYEEMRRIQKFSLTGMKMYTEDKQPGPFLKYRQIIDPVNFDDPSLSNVISLINCTCIDYKEDSILDKESADISKHLYRAKQLSLSYLYWLQTEAPRDDGGKGYPELMLRPDLMGTKDGLAQHPYIRESRRVKGLIKIKEDNIVASCNHGCSRAPMFIDTIGIGWYLYTDIHCCCHTKRRYGSGQNLLPFQIPMGAMITDSVSNFIAGSKNISSTHISSGAYRYHPVEWNIGESAGALAAYAVMHKQTPKQIYNDRKKLRQYQLLLLESGIPLYWFDDVPLDHHDFIPIQFLALDGIRLGLPSHLHFYPDEPMKKIIGSVLIFEARLRYGLDKKTAADLQEKMAQLTRAQFVRELYRIVKDKIIGQ